MNVKASKTTEDKVLGKTNIPFLTTSDEDITLEEQEQESSGECRDDNADPPPAQTVFLPSSSPSEVKLEVIEEDVPLVDPLASRDSQTHKKYRRHCGFDEVTEWELVEWYREHEMFYNKKLRSYRDKARKHRLYRLKAKELGTTVDIIITWLESMRTRFVKVDKQFDRPPGSAPPTLTERDEWIQNAFSFLRPHIVKGRGRRSKRYQIEEPTGARVGAVADNLAKETVVNNEAPVDDNSINPQPLITTRSTKGRRVQDDSLLMEIIKQSQQESSDLNPSQTAFSTTKNHHAVAARQFHSYLATQADQIDPIHWTRYTMDAIKLVARYTQLSTSSAAQGNPASSSLPQQAAAADLYEHQPHSYSYTWS